jgi:heme/copper-type cytochrome/quinol oxidase subunit 2
MKTSGKNAAAPSLRGLEMIIVLLSGALIAVLSIYTGLHIPTQLPTSSAATQQSAPYQLTITEIMDTAWNSTVAQPQFEVVGAHGLESSGNIRLPAHTLIQLTIISYDTPTPGSTDQEGKVNGTIGGTVYLINGTTAMGTNMSQPWGRNVTSVPGIMLAHTFTIPQLGINIPVVGGDTEIAYLYLNQTGTFQWVCLTPCGFGPTGMEGAMSTSGWMEGQVTAY